ncbi:prenyltransferase/squalene oxidase repeat-containing protein [Actinomadura flavalba]|uniref:prenyltransferase/squalene oxidase repeat-containing protein n=1 Tax=Actinomadura flavalba TaxID=1120938 RepID=UPI0003663DD9|nr:prenyltransferase/squalene oxidase repeat-containing protein [Actinomadura flavalba]
MVEASAWIVMLLARAGCPARDDAPDLARAHRWLLRHQNADGGWGSVRGCPSRVWSTCLAVRALARLDPYGGAVERGVQWILRAGGPWGVVPGARPTVTHTAFALIALADARPWEDRRRVRDGYAWLRAHLDPGDDHRWIETYEVTSGAAVCRLALWHHGLPIAVAALLRDPRGAPGPLLARALETMLRDEPSGEGAGSLWALWWRLEVLAALVRSPLTRPRDLLHWLPGATVVQHAHAREIPLARVVRGSPRRLRATLRRHWGTGLLVLVAVGSLGGVATRTWEWKDFWLSVILPMLLAAGQEAGRRRKDVREVRETV